MDELSNVDVTIVTRDKFGVRHIYEMLWDTVICSELFETDSEEILLILAEGEAVLYSRLASGPITRDDVKNFFA